VRPPTAILGGFSQGGVVVADVAFRTNVPLRALLLFSPTIVDEAGWVKAMERRRGLPVFISHGRNDGVLPYEASARLQETMQKAGLAVTWFPFDGGHEIPVPVVEKLNEFLAKL
jgi:phospholipase/carboxylesterase